MSNYVRANTGGATHFGDKDALSTGDADKVIVGAQFDNEYEALVTAVNSKYDSDDLATQAEAEALTSDAVLITPHSLNDVLVENAGILGDLQALADPAANVLFGWNDTANAAEAIINGATAGGGGIDLSVVNEISVDLNDLDTETSAAVGDFIAMVDITDSGSAKITVTNLNNAFLLTGLGDYNANDHIDHTRVTITAGAGMTGGGTIAATRTLNVIAGVGMTVNANDIDFDPSTLSTVSVEDIVTTTDGFVYSDAGVAKVMPIDEAGVLVVNTDAVQTFALADGQTLQVNTTTARTWTIPANAAVAFKIGTVILLGNNSASDLTITADTGVILESVFNTADTTATSDVVDAGGTACLIKVAADEWMLSGDISDT